MPTKRQLRERAREEEPLIEKSSSEKPKDEQPKDEKPIKRQTAVAYWCPFCDFSMQIKLEKCAKCGAIREGNVVRK